MKTSLVISLLMAFVLLFTTGCSKNWLNKKGPKKTIEGIIYEDCNGRVSIGQKIYLSNYTSGCISSSCTSQDSTLTDENGYFKFEYFSNVKNNNSTLIKYHVLNVPQSSITMVDPEGYVHLYPNDTLMNVAIQLRFQNSYTSKDTFYYQFKPSPNGSFLLPQHKKYIIGPFHDTTIILNQLIVGNTNSQDYGKSYCGVFKWGIGINRLDSYYTGLDGYFTLTHTPCATIDKFEYNVSPIY